MLKLTGVAGSTAFVAGCGGGGGGNGGNGGNGGGGDGYEIDPGQDIMFAGQTSEWEGLQPSAIEGESNPTLILQSGETYTIGWSEGDDQAHNLELRNSDGTVVDDYTTGEPVASPDEPQTFEFDASDDIAIYRCEPHPQMEGEIQIQDGGGGGGNETTGNETGGNETGGNETGGNETAGNETGGNETGGNLTG